MTTYEQTPRIKRAKGTLDENGNRSIAIRFDGSTFRKISDEATRNGRTFAEQVRLYVGLGMEKTRVSA